MLYIKILKKFLIFLVASKDEFKTYYESEITINELEKENQKIIDGYESLKKELSKHEAKLLNTTVM